MDRQIKATEILNELIEENEKEITRRIKIRELYLRTLMNPPDDLYEMLTEPNKKP